MAQWEKGMALKMSDMNLIPETHMVEGKLTSTACLLDATHVLWNMYLHTYVGE